MQYEKFAYVAYEKKEWRESIFYAGKILESCPDSMNHVTLKIESMISNNPSDMTDAIRFTTQIQEKFIDHPLFLFWRGRVLIYNGQLDMGKKHIRQALNVDPDNKLVAKFWKSMTTMEKIKDQANEEFKL